ncbi:MAG: hypothetical protein ABJA02_04800 [Acidobacteriota bacterium]
MKFKALLCSALIVVGTCSVFARTTEFTCQGSLKQAQIESQQKLIERQRGEIDDMKAFVCVK